ncbi:methionine adenosyltransferase [Patescibacteria group bacterium]|nr:methionine adenosyltransferase [Patescibacteria group bacterium]MBU1702959.1 methionine adenosyltransferase [Patescibacteria group bacterium]MBU1953967.1 methionine adenosyltransferase [Patescibacteria group bacterium]
MANFLFTSESVTDGHPDKIADQISDTVLDDILRQDPMGRVACEAIVTTGLVLVAGEISTKCYSDIPKLVRGTLREIGYNDATYGFDADACAVLTAIDEQSPDIAMGVNPGGAGDQGLMFGYACNETPQLMPLPIMLAHGLAKKLGEVRRSGLLDYLRPDGKSQVTVEYENGKPKRVHTALVSTQHGPQVDHDRIKKDVIEHVIKPVCGDLLDDETVFHVNPTGKFIIGGPPGDCGLTGRKIIVDTYGGMAPHGGGCFSGKDPTKVDRSASYYARYAAKNVVAAGLADKCQIQLAYAIGVADPLALHVQTFGTGKVDDEKILELIHEHFDFRPLNIIEELQLRRPIYKRTAAFGHFGRDAGGGEDGFNWELLNKVEALKNSL